MDIEKDTKEVAPAEAAPAKEEAQVHTLLLCYFKAIQRFETPSLCWTRSSQIRRRELLPELLKMCVNTRKSLLHITLLQFLKVLDSSFHHQSNSLLVLTKLLPKNSSSVKPWQQELAKP